MEKGLSTRSSLERRLERKVRRDLSCRRFQKELRRHKIFRIGALSGYQNNDTWHFSMAKQYIRWGYYNRSIDAPNG
jgi:hypothetical protein